MHGLGSVAYGVKDNGFSVFLLIFYNQVLGIDAGVVGTVIMAGLATAPVNGEKLVGQMALRIAEWVRARHVGGAAVPAARK